MSGRKSDSKDEAAMSRGAPRRFVIVYSKHKTSKLAAAVDEICSEYVDMCSGKSAERQMGNIQDINLRYSSKSAAEIRTDGTEVQKTWDWSDRVMRMVVISVAVEVVESVEAVKEATVL